jgi:DNA-binding response OmpR family regulator
MRILLVEDDPVARRQMQAALERGGHEVETAADGEAAWALLQSPDAPRLVVLDWDLPGLDGVAIIDRVRAVPGHSYTYLVLVTGKGLREDVIAGLDAGADDYLVKPIDTAVLRARVRSGERILRLETALAARIAELEAQLGRRRDAA